MEGEYEHYYMAKRALATYKDLLNTFPFEPLRYEIRSTEISRAGESAVSYSFGIVSSPLFFHFMHFNVFWVVC